MAEVGPDGAVWVIDWYNYIVQHNPTPQGFETGKGNAYVSDLRDKKHGRIYRVVPTNTHAEPGEPRQRPGRGSLRSSQSTDDIIHEYTSLAAATNEQLVETLRHPSFMWRLTAQRLLVERNAGQNSDVLGALLQLVQDQAVDEAGLNVGAIHALHTLKALGYGTLDRRTLSASAIVRPLDIALSHPSAGVRRNALVFLSNDPSQTATDAHTKNALSLVLKHPKLFEDADAQVRLQAFLTLADLRSNHQSAIEPICESIDTATDPVLLDAITAAASVHAARTLSRITANESEPSLRVARQVAEHIGRGRPSAEEFAAVMADLRMARPKARQVILDGLTAGIPSNFEFQPSAAFDALLVDIFRKADESSKSRLIRLATKCGITALDSHATEIAETMLRVVADIEADEGSRIASARDLVEFRPNDLGVVSSILKQLTAQTAPGLGRGFLRAVQLNRSAEAGNLIVEVVPALTPQLRSAAIVTLLSRPDWARSLLNGLRKHNIELTDLSLDQKQSLRTFPDSSVANEAEELLAMSGSLPDRNRDKVLRAMLHLCQMEGNVDVGRDIFRKHCARCHKHGDLSDKSIGPNLTGMAVHPKAELLTHIIDPSRSVEGNFRVYTVVRTDGRVTSGMLAAETRTSVTLIDTEAKEWNIQRTDIEELIASRKSLMPDGFEKQMTFGELSDLLEFLTSKGQYLPVALDRYATAISTKGLVHEGDTGPDRMVFSDWTPKVFNQIPFVLTNPRGKTTPNIILLYGPRGTLPPRMPRSVILPCNTPAKCIHLLSGTGGWNYPAHKAQSVSMIVRLNYADGSGEDHELLNGVHFADYIRRIDVPASEFAFDLNGQQIRYLSVVPDRHDEIESIQLLKGNDPTAPIVMALTIER